MSASAFKPLLITKSLHGFATSTIKFCHVSLNLQLQKGLFGFIGSILHFSTYIIDIV